MTFTEMLLAMVLIAATLGGLQVLSASLRAETADEQTRRTLRSLRVAAVLHHRLHQQGEISDAAAAPLHTGPTAAALTTLLAHPRTASILASLKIDHAGDRTLLVRDGYGRPIRYLPPTPAPGSSAPGSPGSPAPGSSAAGTTASAAARPSGTTSGTTSAGGGDFVSAGPDGLFGLASGGDPAAADNLYGSDQETNP